MSGHKLRILSSENDASVKVQQDQNTNITLKLEPSQPNLKDQAGQPLTQSQPIYTPPGFIPGTTQPAPMPGQELPAYPQPMAVGPLPSQQVQYNPSAYAAVDPTQVLTREIDLTENLADKDHQIEVLEILLDAYENNPLIINKLVVCQYSKLMDIIKILTQAEKVEFTLDEDKSCTCCSSKYVYISKILVTKDGKTNDFKYAFNEMYSLLQKHGISLKICTN